VVRIKLNLPVGGHDDQQCGCTLAVVQPKAQHLLWAKQLHMPAVESKCKQGGMLQWVCHQLNTCWQAEVRAC